MQKNHIGTASPSTRISIRQEVARQYVDMAEQENPTSEAPSKTVLEIRRHDLVTSLQQRVNRVNKILKIMRGGTRQLKNTTNSILQLEMTPKTETSKRPASVTTNSPELKRPRTSSSESGGSEPVTSAQEDSNPTQGSETVSSQSEPLASTGEQTVERESNVSEDDQEAESEERTETVLDRLVPSGLPSTAKAALVRAFAPRPGETAEQTKARYFASLPCIKRQRDLYRLNPLLPRDPETLAMFREGTKNNCPPPQSDHYGFGRTGEDVDRENREDAARAEQCKPPWEKNVFVSSAERLLKLIKFFKLQTEETLEQAKARVFPTLPIIRTRRDLYRLDPDLPRDAVTLQMFTEKTAGNVQNSLNDFYPAGQTGTDADRENEENAAREAQCEPPWLKHFGV